MGAQRFDPHASSSRRPSDAEILVVARAIRHATQERPGPCPQPDIIAAVAELPRAEEDRVVRMLELLAHWGTR